MPVLHVGVTDSAWFDFLATQRPDEVNFWRPGGGRFCALPPGGLFLFKRHGSQGQIAGGGFFVSFSQLPVSIAWKCFGTKNGASDYQTFSASIHRYRRDGPLGYPDPTIGCIVLTQPFFLPRERWIPAPADWKPNIVQGKGYTTDEPIGAALWRSVQEALAWSPGLSGSDIAVATHEDRYGPAYLARARLGQGAFRVLVTDAYNRRCAMTGERTLPVLEAAHIQPYAQDGPNAVSNGLLLRADLHILFDQGLLTITPDLRVEVSKRIKAEYENGREYYALHGHALTNLPDAPELRPAPALLEWHNGHVYRP